MKTKKTAGFTAAQIAAARKQGGTIQLGGGSNAPTTKKSNPSPNAPAPAKKATVKRKKAASPKATATVQVTATAGTATAKVRARKKRTARKAAAPAPAPTPVPAPIPVVPTITAVNLPPTKWQRFMAWLKGLVGKQTAPAAAAPATTAPATTQAAPQGATPAPGTPAPTTTQQKPKSSGWMGWFILAIAICAIIGFVVWKVKHPQGMFTTAGDKSPGTNLPAIITPADVPATNQAVANPAVEPTTKTNSVGSSATPSKRATAPQEVKGIDGDNNDHNNVFVNTGTFQMSFNTSTASAVGGGTNWSAVANLAADGVKDLGLPPGVRCSSLLTVDLPESERNGPGICYKVEMVSGQAVKVQKAPPGWRVNIDFHADGPVIRSHNGVPIDRDCVIDPGTWCYYMQPGTTRCTLEITYRK